MADVVDVLGNLRVFDNHAAVSNFSHDRTADLCLGGFGQYGIRGTAHIRKLDVLLKPDVVGIGAAGENGDK